MNASNENAEQVVLARYKERCHRAGAIQTGYGMRAKAIRYLAPEAEIDRALQGMVEKGWLKPNAAGTWYFLTEAGAEQVKAVPNGR
ncbi:MAG TPA: hypothetical protein VN493_25285 [Thermoanaerobaculia bacterium]|nr:hypothetical protein [Thermoanaerobaculia bacterium]